MFKLSITSSVSPQFLMRGERVHALASRDTWAGQVVTVVATYRHESGLSTDGVPSVLIDARDCEGRKVSFFAPMGSKIDLAG